MKTKNYLLTISLFLLAFSGLTLEILFTRYFSYIFTHSYVYLIISIGISGLGFGSYFFYRNEKQVLNKLVILTFFPIILIILMFILNSFFPNIYINLFSLFFIFMAIGIGLTLIYKNNHFKYPIIYFLDLLGASAGSILVYFLMKYIGVIKSIQIAFIILVIALYLLSLVFVKIRKSHKILSIIIIMAFSISLLADFDNLIRISNNMDKDIVHFTMHSKNAKIVESSWKDFGRVDLVEGENSEVKNIFIDGAAGTRMVKYDENLSIEDKMYKHLSYTPTLGMALLGLNVHDPEEALVIGSGGGIEVASLLYKNTKKVTAVEINKGFIDTVKKYSEFNGNIYNKHPRVDLVYEEGRHYVKTTPKKFNIVLIAMPLIKSIRNFKNYAMSENYLFTSNAIRDYYGLLKDDGYFIVEGHSNLEIFRLLMNTLKAFEGNGLNAQEALKHIAIIEFQHTPLLIVKKSVFNMNESTNLHGVLHKNKDMEEGVNFVPFLKQMTHPMIDKNNEIIKHLMFNNYIYKLSIGEITVENVLKDSINNIKPINDDSPFFYYFDAGIPGILVIILLISLFTLIYFSNKIRRKTSKPRYFILIGIAFIMLEIGFIQKFNFYWGQKSYVLSILLSIILASTGLGSFVSRFFKSVNIKLRLISILIPLFILIFILFNRFYPEVFFSGIFKKSIITLLFIFPSFFTMGFAFPTLLNDTDKKLIPIMIGFNSIAALFGTVLSLMIAIKFGFLYVLLAGAILYIGLLFYRFEKNN